MGRRRRVRGVGLLGDLFGGLALLALLLLWRLAAGPIALDALAPHIEAALDRLDPQLSATIGEPQLRLDRGGRTFELVVSDVRARGESGEVVIELPEVEVDFSLQALLGRGILAPRRLEARAPVLALIRRPDGSIGLRGLSGQGTGIDLVDLAAILSGPRRGDHALDHLEALGVSGARVVIEDEISGHVLEADTGEIALLREAEGVQGRLFLAVGRGDRQVRVQGQAWWTRASDRVGWRLQLGDLAPEDLAAFLPRTPVDLAGIRLLLDAVVSGEAILGGGLGGPVDVYVAGDGVVGLPGILPDELPLDRLEVRGQIAADGEGLAIEELVASSRGASFAASGTASWGDGLALQASVRASEIETADLERFWPIGLSRHARAWVTRNITAGRVPSAELTIDLQPGDLDQRPLRKEAVRGAFDYRDLTIHYYRPLPPITGIDGRATVTAQGLTFAVAAGRVDELVINEGSVVITGIGIPGRDTTQLEVEVDVAGPFRQALALIDHEPLALTRKLGIDPAASRGRSRTALRIGLPLHDDVSDQDVWIDARAALSEVAVNGLLGEIDIEDGDFRLEATTERMRLLGRAAIEGVALDVEWEEFFTPTATLERQARLLGRLEPSDFAALGIELPLPFEGAVDLEAEVSEGDGTRWIDLTFDLVAAALEVPALDWRKPVGEPGSLEATLTLTGEGPIEIGRFDVAAAGLRVTGRIDLDRVTRQPRHIDLDRFELGEQSLTAEIERREDDGYRVLVRARRLDLDALLGEGEGEGQEPAPAAEPLPFELDLVADRVRVGQGEVELRDLSAAVVRERAGWRRADMASTLPGGGRFTLTLTPEGDSQRLRVMADDAGDLLRAFDQTRRLEGGELTLNATIHEQSPLRAEGMLRIRRFTLREMPLVARILTLASLQGLRDIAGGEGLWMDRLEVPFMLAGGVLTIGEGRISGSQLGLTFEGTVDLERDRIDLNGTVVPVYTLNRIIGSIPVLGDFLTGREGEGAFAATYTVQGPREEPQITVNPLAVLAPGFIRELFTGLAEGTLEPPEPGR